MPSLTNVAVHLPPTIIREVSISSTSSAATPTTTTTEHATPISIPAIVGGTAAGIALAVAVVLAWKWWSLIIRQPNKKCRSRRVCSMQISTIFVIHSAQQQNTLKRLDRATPIKPNEVSNSDGAGCEDGKKSFADSSPNTRGTPLTPLQHSSSVAAPLPIPPIKPPRNPARALRRPSAQFKESLARGSRSSFARASNRLSYKSTISTASVYSTQTDEEQHVRVPAAVITAALGSTRHLSRLGHSSEPYTIGEEQVELVVPSSSLRDSDARLHRVSNISAGSLCLQQGAQTTELIGVAYGGEES
ncbi:hypothetical protein CY34DRAFT_10094 [Suillus luteus UH-Slu-Lm8-n1]|uniref:Uncharacterized protein n=1 Tax=Suillus luteus UH-Slu-Lm8-n1 TaxID=930992 RepID=A0A0D0B7X6_9AGAM|nr:hypothetical protein CY34DRAFT_10094 [Suillus luteus UH-Slu-Lm8-n1]